MHRIKSGPLLLLLSSFWIAGTTSAIPIGIGYAVTEVSTPDRVVGDVVVAGEALFVGAGSFGDQSLYRIDSDGTTTLASGFSSMGGMAYDVANDRLLLGDNGLEFSSSGSGDTYSPMPVGTSVKEGCSPNWVTFSVIRTRSTASPSALRSRGLSMKGSRRRLNPKK